MGKQEDLQQEMKHQWDTEGYVVVRPLFSPERAARLREICEDLLKQFRACDPQTGNSADPDCHCMRHLNHPAYFSKHPEWFPEIMNAAADEAVLSIGRAIFGSEPLFRCTSLFFNPLKTSLDGNWHRDSQFVTKTDEEEKQRILSRVEGARGVQLQVALAPTEDIEFVPGSHLRWDTPEEYAIRKADGGRHNRSSQMPGAIRIKQQPGDAVLFNANGHHRGRYHTDRLRRTLMLTYTTESAATRDYFTDQPWFLEHGHLDSLSPATRAFFEKFTGTFKDWWLEKAQQPAAV